MKIIKLTQGFETIVDDDDYEVLSKYKWCAIKDKRGSVYAVRGSRKLRRHIFLHRVILNNPSAQQCDHKNGNTLDNRKENLRACTPRQNAFNRRKSNIVGLTSKYKGVSWNKKRKIWRAFIYNAGQVYLGSFNSEEDAYKAYCEAGLKLHGEFFNPG